MGVERRPEKVVLDNILLIDYYMLDRALRKETYMEHIDKTIEELRAKITEKEGELIEMKKTVNQLCRLAKHSPLYPDEIKPEKTSTGLLGGDEYYMQPIARVIGWILERRKAAGAGPATVEEIYDAMKAGGYKFDAKDDENAMRGISISMCKNVAKFHRLPSGKFGLTEWYPELKEPKEPKKTKRRKYRTVAKPPREEKPQEEPKN
jgi:hypothetical protein